MRRKWRSLRMTRITSVLAALLLMMPAPPVRPAMPESHALLIGVQDYRGTDLISLEGPVNDVRLVRELLVSRFQVPPKNVTTLIDSQATHIGIEEGFAELASRVKAGDFVYIQYSGHGSYTEDKNGDEAESGQDQTWVSFGARAGTLTGDDDVDILDDEIIEWLIPIYEKTDHVVFVSDSCHSASVSRGERRGVRSAEPDQRPHPLAAGRFRRWRKGEAPGIRIGAARDAESAVEIIRASGSYGLFTWYWVESLNAALRGETWEEVFKRAYTRVTAKRGVYQRPQLEGGGARVIFGGQFRAPVKSVPVIRVDAAAGLAKVRTGAVNGATVGSVYRLYRHGELQGSSPGASLELTRLRPYSSEAKIRQGTFKVGDLVVETDHAYMLEPIRLAVEGDFTVGKDRQLVQQLSLMVRDLDGFALVSDRREADWIIYVLRPRRSGSEYLFDGTGTLPASDRMLPPEAWVLSPQEELVNRRLRVPLKDPTEGIGVLEKNLTRFARIRELKRLASRADPPPIAVTVIRLRPTENCEDDCVSFPDEHGEERLYEKLGPQRLGQLAGATVRKGEVLTFAVKNEGKRDYYVYLINLSPDGKIHAIFPLPSQRREHARVAPDKTRDLTGETGLLLNVEGNETVKVIVSGEPIDVRLFEMEGYAAYTQTRGQDLNPMERLLARAMSTRGAPVRLRQSDWGTIQVGFAVSE